MIAVLLVLAFLWAVLRTVSAGLRAEVENQRTNASIDMARARIRYNRGLGDGADAYMTRAANGYFRARHIEARAEQLDRWTWPPRWSR